MYSKHSALGSRMLRIIWNNDVMPFSHPRVFFWNNNQKWWLPVAKKSLKYDNLTVLSRSPLFKIFRIWSFHFVFFVFLFFLFVFFWQRTAKKCTKIYNTRAELLSCSFKLFLTKFSLPLPSWFAKTFIVDIGHCFANGIIISLTWGGNSYSGIVQNISLFRNKVKRAHPKCCL